MERKGIICKALDPHIGKFFDTETLPIDCQRNYSLQGHLWRQSWFWKEQDWFDSVWQGSWNFKSVKKTFSAPITHTITSSIRRRLVQNLIAKVSSWVSHRGETLNVVLWIASRREIAPLRESWTCRVKSTIRDHNSNPKRRSDRRNGHFPAFVEHKPLTDRDLLIDVHGRGKHIIGKTY